MSPNDTLPIILTLFITFIIPYIVLLIVIAILRNILWNFSLIFHAIDQFMWFLYNPLRVFMKDANYQQKSVLRMYYVLFHILPIIPLYKFIIYVITTPLRLINSIYYDVIMYTLVSAFDSVDELLHPKLGTIRHKTGMAYLWRWIIFLPYRLTWFIVKNIFYVIDSFCMVIVSIAWPTFTMYHGSSQDAIVNISQQGRWLVGTGNYAGSGIYFGRRIKTAKHYAKSTVEKNTTYCPIILTRVTFTVLRNCSTLPLKLRQHVGNMGEGGRKLAQELRFPFTSTELWRQDTKWWEYCILQGGKDRQFVNSWRVRAIGYLQVKGDSNYAGSLKRLWGGKSHYCLRLQNLIMTGISFFMLVYLLRLYASIF